MAIRVKQAGQSLKIDIDHPVALQADPDIIAGCLQAVLDCASSNGCFDGRLALTDACLTTVAKHNDETKCVTSCFGCA